MRRAVSAWWRLVVLDELNAGRPRPRGWSPTLRGVGWLGASCLGVLVVLMLASSLLRRHGHLVIGSGEAILPAATVPFLVWGILVATMLAQLGGLRAHPLLSVLTLGLSLVTIAQFLATSGSALLTVGLVALAAAALIGLTVSRRGRRFGAIDVVVVALAVLGPALVGLFRTRTVSGSLGYDGTGLAVSGLLVVMSVLASPALLVSGYTVSSLTVRAATGLAPALPARRGVLALIGVLLAVVGAEAALGRLDLAPPGLPGSLAVVALVALGVVPLYRWQAGRSRRLGARTELGTEDVWQSVLYPLALGMFATLGPVIALALAAAVAGALGAFGWPAGLELHTRLLATIGALNSPLGVSALRILVGAAGLAFAWWRTRRGEPRLVPAATVLFAIVVVQGVGRFSGGRVPTGWSPDILGLGALGLGLIVVAVRRLRGRLAPGARAHLLTLVALVALYPLRQWLADPLGWVVGSVGLGVAVFGLVWRIFTDGAFTRHTSRGLPSSSRICLYLANLVFAATVLAFAVLSRSGQTTDDIAQIVDTGELLFGTPLWLGAVCVSFLGLLTPASRGSGRPPAIARAAPRPAAG